MRRSQWSAQCSAQCSALVAAALLVLTGACATTPARSAEPGRAAPFAAAHNDTSTPFNLVSVPALVRHRYDAGPLRVGGLVEQSATLRRYHVSYRSGKLRVSGLLSVPRREGRFPLVVLAHGYEDPARYRSGVALAREQRYLTERGYVVLLTDYRNFGDSDRDGPRPVTAPLGYPEDVVNAILAVRRARFAFADTGRVGLVGRSMGGGVALAAAIARPGLVDALVLYSPVSSLAADNFHRWVVPGSALDERVRATYGLPADNPAFWAEASVRNHLDRLAVPVQVHHGTDDDVCPVTWSRATVAALRAAGQTVEYAEYPGEDHRFDPAWSTMARRMARFLDQNV